MLRRAYARRLHVSAPDSTIGDGSRTSAVGRRLVAGLELDPFGESETVEHLLAAFRGGRGGQVVFVNVDVALRVRRDPGLHDLVQRTDLLLADGMPLVWASRLCGAPLPERVAGSTVLARLLDRATAEELPVMLLGGRPGSAESVVDSILAEHPSARVGWHTPPYGFERDPGALEDLHGALDSFGRCLCFVGLGFPKQERLMASLAARRPDWWFIASGGGIDFLGEGDRAPEWMQRVGMEWFYRLRREPRRLARRYLVDDVPFATRLLLVSAWQGLRRA